MPEEENQEVRTSEHINWMSDENDDHHLLACLLIPTWLADIEPTDQETCHIL